MKHFWLIGFVVLSLNACSLFGQTYVKPNIDVPNQWYATNLESSALVNNLPYMAWWNTYNDPVLNRLIESGIRNNNNIYMAMANLEYSKGQLKQVEFSWIPSIPFLFGFSQMPSFGNAGTVYGIWPQYAINVFSQIHAQKQAKYMVEVSNAQKDAIILTIIGQIAGSYFTYIAQTEQLNLYQKLAADINELLKITNAAYNGGLYSDINVEELETELAQIKAREVIVKNNIIVSQNALRFLLNQNPGSIKEGIPFAKLFANKLEIGSIPITVLANRPDVIEAEANLKAANQGVGLATSNLLPSIKLDSFIGGYSGNGTVAAPNTFSVWNEAYASVPILNAQAYGQIEASKGAYTAAYYNYINVLRNALQRVDNSYIAYGTYSNQLKANSEAFNSAVKEYNLVLDLYNRGINSYADSLINRLKVDNLALVVNQDKLQQFMSVVMLYQELSGGYKYASNIIESKAK